ncbi:MAG: hypothetical protein OXH86_09815 [Acidimicrobiaceae bacterium]|nr:hypothetical protein [Acidimicrobiaceae bacterium]
MRGRGALFAAATVLFLPGCSHITDGGECLGGGPPGIVPIDLSGTWAGTVRDAISVRFELRQANMVDALDQYGDITGTVSITIPGPVETSGSVEGWTHGTAGHCDESRITGQSFRVFGHLTVMPTDQIELPLHIDMLYGTVDGGEIDVGLIYTGPTAVTFDENGKVTGIELDSFTGTALKLTRAVGRNTR